MRQTVFNHQSSGIEANNRDLQVFSRYLHENKQAEITGDSLLEFIRHLKEKRKNGAGAINRKISSIRSYIKYLRFRRVEGAEELAIENLGRAREPYRGPQEALEVDEVQHILTLIDRQSVLGFRDFLFYSLLYRLGLRIGEAISINLEDINWKKQTLRIHGKGRKERLLPLVSDLPNLIKQWIEIRRTLHKAGEQEALFISKKGNRLAIRTAQENFQKLVIKAGPLSLAKVTPHSLRHAFASHAVDGDANLVVLKHVLGHARFQSTQIYVHPSLKVLRKAVDDHPAAEILNDLIKEEIIILRTQQKKIA